MRRRLPHTTCGRPHLVGFGKGSKIRFAGWCAVELFVEPGGDGRHAVVSIDSTFEPRGYGQPVQAEVGALATELPTV